MLYLKGQLKESEKFVRATLNDVTALGWDQAIGIKAFMKVVSVRQGVSGLSMAGGSVLDPGVVGLLRGLPRLAQGPIPISANRGIMRRNTSPVTIAP